MWLNHCHRVTAQLQFIIIINIIIIIIIIISFLSSVTPRIYKPNLLQLVLRIYKLIYY
jgi:uncharacterized protein YggT (Ycf19 family)